MLLPQFVDQFKAAADCGCRLRFQTNGQLLTPALSAKLLSCEAWERLDISTDAVSPELYDRIREGGSFGRLHENLLAFKHLRGDKANPVLNIEFVAMRQNIHELPALVEFAAAVGAASVLVTELFELPTNPGQTLAGDPDTLRPWVLRAREVAGDVGVRLDLQPSEAAAIGQSTPWAACGGAEDGKCRTPWHVAFVRPDGGVQPCCRIQESMGSLKEREFDEIWRGEKWEELRARIEEGDSPSICWGCGWV